MLYEAARLCDKFLARGHAGGPGSAGGAVPLGYPGHGDTHHTWGPVSGARGPGGPGHHDGRHQVSAAAVRCEASRRGESRARVITWSGSYHWCTGHVPTRVWTLGPEPDTCHVLHYHHKVCHANITSTLRCYLL